MAARTWGDLLVELKASIAARDWDRGADTIAHLRREAEHQGDPKTLASAAFHIGMFHDARGALAEAEAAFGEAVSWDERAWGPKHETVADALRSLGMVQARQKKLDAALASFDRAADIHAEAGDLLREAEVLLTAGNALRLAGDLETAFTIFAEARKLVKDRRDLPARIAHAHALLGASESRRQAGDRDEALKLAWMATQDGVEASAALESMLARAWIAVAMLSRGAAGPFALEIARSLTHEPAVRAQIEALLARTPVDAPIPDAVVADVEPSGRARVFHRAHGAVSIDATGRAIGDRLRLERGPDGLRTTS